MLCLYPQCFKGSNNDQFVRKMPAPTDSHREGGNQEQTSLPCLEQNCCHLFHLSSKDVQQLALCAINSNLDSQRYFGISVSQMSPGVWWECQGVLSLRNQAFPLG